MKEINLIYERNNKLAHQRWKVLAQVLFKHIAADDLVSSSKFRSFDLFNIHPLENPTETNSQWFQYSAVISNLTVSVKIRHLLKPITREELMGFNNTGNLCVWPSEEILAYYAVCNKNIFDNKKVLEIGGGMTCLASILIAKYTNCSCSHMSDGNESSVHNVSYILKENDVNSCDTSCFILKWDHFLNHTDRYDIILAADCIFFDDSRSDLVRTLWHLLLNTGMALVMAPKRGDTLSKFMKEVINIGFHYSIYNRYDDHIWKKHSNFLECDEHYKANIHYPLLIVLTKSSIYNVIPQNDVTNH